MDFMTNHWPQIEMAPLLTTCSPATQKKVAAAKKIWAYFNSRYMPEVERVPGIEEIVAYLFFRVATPIDDAPCAGKISLRTFEWRELGCPTRAFREHFGDRA
jgi:hypothetical protein